MKSTSLVSARIGRWAQVMSLGCAIHCMAMPLLIATLPLLGMGFLLDERLESAVIVGSVVLATASLCWGYREHRKRRVLMLLAAAATLMIGGRFAEGPRETVMVVTGAVTLALSQFLNRRLCKSCACCHVSHTHEGQGGEAGAS